MSNISSENKGYKKSGSISRFKKPLLILLAIACIMGSPLLVRFAFIFKHIKQTMDFDSALIMTQWSDDSIAAQIEHPADHSKATEMNQLIHQTPKVDIPVELGPWNSWCQSDMQNALILFKPQLDLWKEIIDKDQAFLRSKVSRYRYLEKAFSEAKITNHDNIIDNKDYVNVFHLQRLSALLRAGTYSLIENGQYDEAFQSATFLAKLGNPKRAEDMISAQTAAAFQAAGAKAYRSLLNYEPPQHAWQEAWNDLIDLRQYMVDAETFQHMRMRESTELMIQYQTMQRGLKQNPNIEMGKSEYRDIDKQILSELWPALSCAVVDCFNKHALFNDDAIRQKAAENAGKYGLQIPIPGGLLDLPRFGLWVDWYHRVASKETAIFDHYRLPKTIREETDPFTAMLYLQSRYTFTPPDEMQKYQSQTLLTELAFASKVYQQQHGQWPTNLKDLQTLYKQNNIQMPNDPFGENDVWHLGWLTLDDSTRKIFWMQQLGFNRYPHNIERDFQINRAKTEKEKQALRENLSSYSDFIEWREKSSTSTLTLVYSASRYRERYADALKARDAIMKKKEIVKDVRIDVKYVNEDGKAEWVELDTDRAEIIDMEKTRIENERFGYLTFSQAVQKQIPHALQNKGTVHETQTSETATSTPLPVVIRIRFDLDAPEKALAVWRTPRINDEFNYDSVLSESGEIDLRFTIFPEKF